ncbi:MAG: MarR family transcriptional regulator [Aigarchaeota archaeon]|nr:MarR family transcriptional regulator [Candidatus Wolframiiraptor gerlachensis]
MSQPEILVIIFSILFLAQTAIFTYLLVRARRRMERLMVVGELGWTEQRPCDLTETEIRIMELIESRGPQSARDLSRALGLSREHVARTLKRLVEGGLLIREGKPYRYRLTELGKNSLRSRDITES